MSIQAASRVRPKILLLLASVAIATVTIGAAVAQAAITQTRNADQVTDSINSATKDAATITASEFTVIPPFGNPSAISDTSFALFPLNGPNFAILGTGDTALTGAPNDSTSTSTDNGGGGGGHGGAVNDLVQLRIDLVVPPQANCITLDYRWLSEEFPEFVGSEFNDFFIAELEESDFEVSESGALTAPHNFAFGPDGNHTTINAAGTSADNAIGTTYDGGTPVLRATTPVTPGPHLMYLSVADVGDAIYDSAVFLDNLRVRNVKNKADCKRGAADSGKEAGKCQGLTPNVVASGGVATGTNGPDVILGSGQDDIIDGRGGDDIICGRGGDDTIRGSAGDDKIRGNDGRDEISGEGDDDIIRGGKGADDLAGGKGSDRIKGSRGRDLIRGRAGKDVLNGSAGDDEVRGNKGSDVLGGQRGRDTIRGGPGDDDVAGGPGDDTVQGFGGDDVAHGRGGNDTLNGGEGDDKLDGGPGKDACDGGPGNDRKLNCE